MRSPRHEFAICPAAWFVLAIVPNAAEPQASAFAAYEAAVARYPVAEAEAAFVAYCLWRIIVLSNPFAPFWYYQTMTTDLDPVLALFFAGIFVPLIIAKDTDQ